MKNGLLYLFTCIGLAACGGGGGGDSPSTSSTPTGNSAAPQDYREIMASVGRGGKDYYVRLNTDDPNFNRDSLSFPDAGDIRKIKIEGVEFDLRGVRGVGTDIWNMRSGGGGSIINSAQQNLPENISRIATSADSENVVAGVVSFVDLPQRTYREYAFFNGNYTDTAQIPVSGKATYAVSAAYHQHAGTRHRQSISDRYDNILTADFANKTLTGNIYISGSTPQSFPIQAQIQGNRFESAESATQKTKGAFFGKNAAEIGGIFQDINTIGAFVGKRQ